MNLAISTHKLFNHNPTAGVTNTLTLPAGGDQELVGASATQTLTNKTIDASQLSGTVANADLMQSYKRLLA